MSNHGFFNAFLQMSLWSREVHEIWKHLFFFFMDNRLMIKKTLRMSTYFAQASSDIPAKLWRHNWRSCLKSKKTPICHNMELNWWFQARTQKTIFVTAKILLSKMIAACPLLENNHIWVYHWWLDVLTAYDFKIIFMLLALLPFTLRRNWIIMFKVTRFPIFCCIILIFCIWHWTQIIPVFHTYK